MVSKMEERRQTKKVNTEEGRKKYRRLNNELRRITDKANENWWKEGVQVQNYSKDKEEQIQYMLLMNPEEIKKRLKDYIEDLYDKDGKPMLEQFD